MKAMVATDQVSRVLVETSNDVVEFRPALVFGHVVSSKTPVPATRDALHIILIGDETELANLIATTMRVLSQGEALIGGLAEALYDVPQTGDGEVQH